jgi:LmbE family N-acetylglucosaminyl deacetylase
MTLSPNPARPPHSHSAPHRHSVVFFHAHPDDEAIFTGGTIALLAAAGCTVTLIVATSGQLGRGHHRTPDDTGRLREAETRAAAALLGIERVEFLRYRDSGMPGDPANHHPEAFIAADLDPAANEVAAIAAQQHATDLVVYDPGGIYGHPDHIQVHRVGTRAAHQAGIPTLYESTVDRDYLSRRGPSHLVSQAHRHVPPEMSLGVPAGLISDTVGIGDHLETKRAAITAHHSQVPATSDVVTKPSSAFAQVYGLEWYIRHGPPGTLEHHTPLNRHPLPTAA